MPEEPKRAKEWPIIFTEGVPEIDTHKWCLTVDGLVAEKRIFSMKDIMRPQFVIGHSSSVIRMTSSE